MNRSKRILVVDDEEQNRDLLEAMLESLGYESELADGGSDALAKLNAGRGFGAYGHHDAEDGRF